MVERQWCDNDVLNRRPWVLDPVDIRTFERWIIIVIAGSCIGALVDTLGVWCALWDSVSFPPGDRWESNPSIPDHGSSWKNFCYALRFISGDYTIGGQTI